MAERQASQTLGRDADRTTWIGVDVGGTKTLAVAYDAQWNRLGSKRRRTRGYEGPEAGVERLAKTIRRAIEDAGRDLADVAAIGVACPSPVDARRGIVLEAVNLGWRDLPLAEELEQMLGVPVAVLNDVDAGLYAECRFGVAQDAKQVLGIFPGTGIGGALVTDGRVFTGPSISCVEVGHLRVQPDGPRCGCGNCGCLETVAGRLAIAAEAARAAYRGEAPHLLETAGTDLDRIRSGALAAAIREGDQAVERIVRRAAAWLGVALASLVHLFAPDIVVLGGGLVEAMPDLYLEEVRTAAETHVMPAYRNRFEVRVAALGDDASVRGAAAWAARCQAHAAR